MLLKEIRRIFTSYFTVLKKGNILGIIQLGYLVVFSTLGFLVYFLNINSTITLLSYLFTYMSLTFFIYNKQELLLEWTNKILINFLSSFYGQLFIFYMARWELIILHSPSYFVMPCFILSLLFLVLNFETQPILLQQTLFVICSILLFWWRFRTTFFNLEALTENSKIKVEDYELKWSNFILLFNSFFTDNKERGQKRKGQKIPDRLSGTWAQAALNMYKHNPKTSIAIGTFLAGGTATQIAVSQYNITQDRTQRQEEARQLDLRERYRIDKETYQAEYKVELDHHAILQGQASSQKIPSKYLQESICDSKKRILELHQKGDSLSSQPKLVTELNSCLEALFYF